MKKINWTTVLLVAGAVCAVGAVGGIIAMNWNAIYEGGKNLVGQGSVTFDQELAVADYQEPTSPATLTDGVYAYEGSGLTVAASPDFAVPTVNSIRYVSLNVEATAPYASAANYAQLTSYGVSVSPKPAAAATWTRLAAASRITSNSSASVGSITLFATSSTTVSAKEAMSIDITGLGFNDAAKAKWVWEDLAGTAYFEGSKTFLKSDIAKAGAAYDAEVAESSSSSAA